MNDNPIAAAFDEAEDIELPPLPPAGTGDRSGLPDGCPVKALGTLVGTHYFLDTLNQLHEVPCEKLSRLRILTMFGGAGYLCQMFPVKDAEGNDRAGKWAHDRVGETLIQACVDNGIFSPGKTIRGRGAWRGAKGELIFHCGDHLWIDGRPKPPGWVDRYIYPAGPAIPPPIIDKTASAGIDGPAQKILDMICTWNWERGETDAKLVLGSIGAALLGGAPDWRPMLWLTGDAGTGKSTLQKLIRAIFGEQGHLHSADATRAGIFQTLGYDSLPVSLDELEPEAHGKRVQDIIDLARIASSGDLILRGGADGNASGFAARSAMHFSSVLVPPLAPTEKSRMAICELGPLEKRIGKPGEDDAALAPVVIDAVQLGKIGQQFRGRLAMEWPRYDRTFQAYREALIAKGHSQRGADQFGAIGAAYDLLMHDDFSIESALAWAAMLPARDLAEAMDFQPDNALCLDRFKTFSPQIFRSGKLETLSHWLREAQASLIRGVADDADDDGLRVLAGLGVRVMPHPSHREDLKSQRIKLDQCAWLVCVSNAHVGLDAVYAGTRWERGVWSQALKRLFGATSGQQWIDGGSRRCTMIPWETVFPKREKE